MPALTAQLARRAVLVADHIGATVKSSERSTDSGSILKARIYIPSNNTSPAGLIEANTRDPWSKSGKYGLAWVYFGIILLVFATSLRFYQLFSDKIRTAYYQEEVLKLSTTSSPDTDYELSALGTDRSTNKFFPRTGELPQPPKHETSAFSIGPANSVIAFFRFIFYRPIPIIRLKKRWRPIIFPPMASTAIGTLAVVLAILYAFVPQPYYWDSISFGSPPLAVRSGMLAVALMPWIIAMSMKANLVSILTGIGHERLNVLHRLGGYLCLFLSLVHTIPYYVTPIWDDGGHQVFAAFFKPGFYPYGTGIAALVPLAFLCLHSLPQLRYKMYELFVAVHVPVAIVFLAMMFWHCANYLTSWNYLFATMSIWLFSYFLRLFFLNWTNPWQLSWLVGDEAAVTILPENAIKITIPTRMKWLPGQYVYLRMPGISVFENHPFTIASLCSDDFPSDYGEEYRDMILVFRPFGGFTRKVLNSAMKKGTWHTYRAFLDGPYGGMRRRIEAFEDVILIAGGSGITAIVSQLLDLIKRMRDGKAITKRVQVIWALKRPETMEWFKEELRICREFAPPDSVRCQFYITAAKRQTVTGRLVQAQEPSRPLSIHFHEKVNHAFQDIADKRLSSYSTKRHSALIADESKGDPEREKELRRENEDAITALPQAHLRPISPRVPQSATFAPTEDKQPLGLAIDTAVSTPAPVPTRSFAEHRRQRNLSRDIEVAATANPDALDPSAAQNAQSFDFGFPSTPTEFQKNLMRFAFLPAAVKKKDGWSTEYGRPDIPYMLRQMSKEWGRRTCVFVCGPPSMRIDVSNTIAQLQRKVWSDEGKDEIFLHAENYAI